MKKITKRQAILIAGGIVAVIGIVIAVALLAGGSGDTFGAPKVTLSGNVLSWAPVEGAEGYVVIINGIPYETKETSYIIEDTAPGVYDIQVQAVRGNQTSTSETITYTVVVKLGAPVISLSGNVVTWPAVENAQEYEVFLNGKSVSKQLERSYAVNVTEIGEYTITVRTLGYDIYETSDASNAVVYSAIEGGSDVTTLQTPDISIADGQLSWAPVPNATEYKIMFNGVETDVALQTSYQMPVTLAEGTYAITVVASAPASGLYLDSAESNAVTYNVKPLELRQPLFPVVNVEGTLYTLAVKSDGYVCILPYDQNADFRLHMWYLEPVSGTEYVHIKLFNGKYLAWANSKTAADGSECMAVNKKDTEEENLLWLFDKNADGSLRIFNLAHSTVWHAEDGSLIYYLGVKKNDAGLADVLKFGDNCYPVTFVNKDIPYKDIPALKTPVLKIDRNRVSWNGIEHATGYEVYVNGVSVGIQTGTSYELTTYGSVSVIAVCNNLSYINSDMSEYVSYMVDLTQPILPTTVVDGVKYVIGVSSDGYLRPVAASDVKDFKKYVWYLEADGNTGFYNIKLYNGKYMAWSEAGVHADGTEVSAVAKAEAPSPESIQWYITMDGAGGYRIYNVAHSARWSAGSWDNYYGINSGVLKFSNNAPTLDLENKNIPYEELTSLTAPVLSIDGKVVSWSAVPNAVCYEVYVNGTYQTTVKETSYTMTSYGSVRVLAESNGEDYLDSPMSAAVAYMVDLTQPILPTTVVDGVTYLFQIDAEGYVRPVSAEGITDFKKYIWYPEADGDTGYYHIKLYDGRYLAWAASNAADGTEGCAVPKEKAASAAHLQWNITMDAAGGYRIYNVAHSARWSAGSWDYHYGIIDGILKFANNAPILQLENSDIPLDPNDQYVERPVYLDDTWIGYFNVDGKPGIMVGTLDSNGVMLAGARKGELTSLNGYLLSFEQSQSNGWYYIKLANGLYMTRSTTTVTANGSDFAEIIFGQKGTDDVNQLFRLVEVSAGQYKLESKYYADQGGAPKYLREYWGVFKFVENSGEILYLERKDYEEVPEITVDLTKPVVPTFDSDNKTILVPEGQETKIGGTFASLSDYTNYAWLLEKTGAYYTIRLADGRYLYSTAGGSLAYAKAYAETNANDFLWTLTPVGDGQYKIYNVSVGGYPLTADSENGNFHFYSDLGEHSAQLFTFTNVEGVIFAEPQIEQTEQKSEIFSAWLYYNNGSQTLADVNSDGIVVLGGKYDTVSDYSSYVWTFEKITEGDGAGLYMIHMADGRYLSYADTAYDAGLGHTAQAIAAEKNAADTKQWWNLVPDGEGKYKLDNKYLSGFYSNVYLGEYWGVYKFDGSCFSWTFTSEE